MIKISEEVRVLDDGPFYGMVGQIIGVEISEVRNRFLGDWSDDDIRGVVATRYGVRDYAGELYLARHVEVLNTLLDSYLGLF